MALWRLPYHCVCSGPGWKLGFAMARYQVDCAGLTSTLAALILAQDVASLKTPVFLNEAVKPAALD